MPSPKKYTGLCTQWRLSPELLSIVGVPQATRIQFLNLLELHHLQDPRYKRYIYPVKMVKVFV